jgi:hypothetical protein
MHRYPRLVATAVILSLSVVLSTPVPAAECIGVQVPDSVKAGDAELVLNGLGIRKATMLKVKVYVAGLYLPAKSSDPGQILGASQPWHYVLHFVRDVDASDIREAYEEGFKKAAGDKLAGLQQRIDSMNARIIDFKEGQQLSFTNDPAKGITMDVAGKGGDPIEGADFASAFLTLSIGPEPPNEDLKSGLLGGKCE